MTLRGQDIAAVIKEQIEGFGTQVTMRDVGTVVEVGDGIARIHGLSSCRSTELVEFKDGLFGIALNLEEDSVGAVILGSDRAVREEMKSILQGESWRCLSALSFLDASLIHKVDQLTVRGLCKPLKVDLSKGLHLMLPLVSQLTRLSRLV